VVVAGEGLLLWGKAWVAPVGLCGHAVAFVALVVPVLGAWGEAWRGLVVAATVGA
jgi:hypothetical protein